MKRLLIGTTALVAAGALASGAQAADPISIGVGGYFSAAVSIASQDMDQNKRSYGLEREGEIIFSGSTTLDNGLSVGVRVDLEAETSGDQIDESFMWISGAFGQVRAGSFDGAMNVMGVYAAGVGAPLHGLFFESYTAVEGAGSVGEGAFGLGIDYDSAKIAWYSPTVGGARIGVSFTPEGGSDDYATTRSNAGTPAAASVVPCTAKNVEKLRCTVGTPAVDPGEAKSQQSEVVGVGGNWSGDFGGASVSVGAGYTVGNIENPQDGETDQEEWIIGASASMDAITVGGNYSVDNKGKASNGDRTTVAVGATHAGLIPGVSVGIRYALTTTERAGKPDLDGSGVSVGFSWGLGSGLSVGGEVQFWDLETADGNNEATAAIIGTTVRF